MQLSKRFKVGISVISILLLVLIFAQPCLAAPKGVQGNILSPHGQVVTNATVRIHVIATLDGTGTFNIPCTTIPIVFTDLDGYYISNLENLRRDDNNGACGSLWFGNITNGDHIWADVNGSSADPFAYGFFNSTHTTIKDMSGVTMTLPNTTLPNIPPNITGIYANATNGGNITTVFPINATDNGDNLSIYCCFDTTNSCTPSIASNQCGGNWENITHDYSTMNCTYSVPSGIDTIYYARCAVKEYQYNTTIVSTSFIVDGIYPTQSDNFMYNNTWVKTGQTITLSNNCNIVGCNGTYYCTGSDTCTPDTNYTTPVTISDENETFFRYQTVDNLGKQTNITSYKLLIDKGAPIIDDAAVTAENDTAIILNSTININWSGFSDNLSGIVGYYINFTNNENTTGGWLDTISPGMLNDSPQGMVHVYVWAIDLAGNIGLAVNDSFITDSQGPDADIWNISEDSGGEYTYYNAPTTTFCYAAQAAQFTILINASDPYGIQNATGGLAFGDSPYDNTPVSGDVQFNLTYTIETPTPSLTSLEIEIYDNFSNSRNLTLGLLKDTFAPAVTTITDNLSWWSPSADVNFSWLAPNDACGVAEYYWNVDNTINTTTTAQIAQTTGNSEGNHTFYLNATDNMGNTGSIGTHGFGVDTTAPATPSGLSDQDNYDNDGTYDISWNAVSDISSVYYEIFESDNGGTWINVQNETTTSATLNGKSNGHNYTYFVRARNGAGLASGNSTPTTGILVDTTAPFITGVVIQDLNHTSSGSLNINATAGDVVAGFNITPIIAYKYGSDAWSSAADMTLRSGNESYGNYTYEIPEPALGWSNYRGQLIYWNITVVDKAGNVNSTFYNTTDTSINQLTFNVTDRIGGSSISNVNISGGTQCADGCIFNGQEIIYEENGNYTFIIKASGFTINTTQVSVATQDLAFYVKLNDSQAPTVSFMNYSVSIASNSTYYARVYANITENLNLDRAYVDYVITEYFSDSGQANFTLVSGSIYKADLGPYNESFNMTPSIFINDTYGFSDSAALPAVWFVSSGQFGGVAIYNSGDESLELQSGWNLISVPYLSNHTVEKVFAELSNGNWGCGRNGTYPGCDVTAGDFAGNFTKIMGYNESDNTWITFNPTDLYTAVDSQEIDQIDVKKGYWINMTRAQTITLDLKFD